MVAVVAADAAVMEGDGWALSTAVTLGGTAQ